MSSYLTLFRVGTYGFVEHSSLVIMANGDAVGIEGHASTDADFWSLELYGR